MWTLGKLLGVVFRGSDEEAISDLSRFVIGLELKLAVLRFWHPIGVVVIGCLKMKEGGLEVAISS